MVCGHHSGVPPLARARWQDHRYNNPVCLVWFEVLRLQLSRHRQAEARRKVIRNLRLMWRLKIVKKALRRKALGDPEALRAKLLNQLEVCHLANLFGASEPRCVASHQHA